MLQKTTTLAIFGLLLGGSAAAVRFADGPATRPAGPDRSTPAIARRAAAGGPLSRVAPVAIETGDAAATPAAPGGGGAGGLRTSGPPIDVAVDEAIRGFVDDALRQAAGSRMRGGDWTPGDVVLRVLNDRADLAIACREPTPGERRRGLCSERLGHLIAVLVPHPSNPITNLEADAVRDLVRGAVTDWRELGGRPGPVQLVLPPPGPQSDLFARLLARGDRFAKDATFAPTDEERLKLVAADPGAVAVVTFEAAQRAKVATLRIGGVPPGPGAVHIGRYNCATPVALIHDGSPIAVQMSRALLQEARARRALGWNLTLDDR